MSRANGVTLWHSAAAFDAVAESYDLRFTDTAVGRAQRKQVWASLLTAFPAGSRILELNCGTGEDARFLSRQGRPVVACDASAAMLEVARNHSEDGSYTKVQYLQVANEDLGALAGAEPFQGAFSNFSGLKCVFEVLWYLVHGQPRTAARRFSGKATAHLGGRAIAVFYPTAGQVCRCFSPWFRLRSQRAIGVFVPPSYLEQSIRNRPKLLERLEWLDSFCKHWPIFRGAGDHMLLEFTRCCS